MPEVALAPDQSPLAVQDVALVDDQVRVEDPLYATEVGLAEIVTVGEKGSHLPVLLFQEEVLESQLEVTVL